VRALYTLALQYDDMNAALLNNFGSLLAQLNEFEAAEAQVEAEEEEERRRVVVEVLNLNSKPPTLSPRP